MRYKIVKQFIPGNDQIWVDKVDDNDELHYYGTLEEAESKKSELESLDSTRVLKIVEVED
jgi:hypothetical protein